MKGLKKEKKKSPQDLKTITHLSQICHYLFRGRHRKLQTLISEFSKNRFALHFLTSLAVHFS